MIPIRLKLRNFMSYRDDMEPLDLSGVHLACLSGENGAGKSAILESLTWVLWGRARGQLLNDELISKGATEMEVDFHFILGDRHYRVIRKRSLKGSKSTPMLDFFVSPDGEEGTWRSLSGASVNETQARINNEIKIDYQTFINSAFILQGRADEFTVRSSADRKKVLADILGLDQYERLEKRAKEEAQERRGKMADLETRLAIIEGELRLRPDHERDLKEVEAKLIEAQEEHVVLRAELSEIASRKQSLEHSSNRINELQSRMASREARMVTVKARVMQNQAQKQQLEELLSRREEIERGYADWHQVQSEERRYNILAQQRHDLQLEHKELESQIAIARAGVSSKIAQHEAEIAKLGRNLAGRGTLEAQLSEVLDKVRQLQQLEQQQEDTRCTLESLEVKMRTVTVEREAIKNEGLQLRQKLDLIESAHAEGKGHVGCPLCGTGLSVEAMERVRRSFEEEIAAKRREFDSKSQQLTALNKEIVATQKRLDAEREQLKPLAMHRQREATLRAKIEGLDHDEQELTRLESALHQLRITLNEDDFAHEARHRLREVAATINGLDYDREAHASVQQRVKELRVQDYDRQYHELDGAGRQLVTIRETLEADTLQLQAWEAEQDVDREEVEALMPKVGQLEDVEQLLAAKQEEEKQLANEVHSLAGQRGELRHKLQRCDQLQEEKERHTADLQKATDEKVVYDELAKAFGKDGIQVMIIENVIPDLEKEANALLHRMTDGRMSVQLTTQQDAKSSKNVLEKLEIVISDEMGSRLYELYSGGEAFRVNFAIRVALSKLLARRAGAQLQTLVIDEGFGSQDGQGRERLIGAIRSIQGDFEKILVITHIEELKEEFPVRINVVKTEAGSKISMVAA